MASPRSFQVPPHVLPKVQLAQRVNIRLLALGVLANAVIAGRTLIGEWDILVHGIIGNGVFVLSLLAVVFAIGAGAGRAVVIATAVLLVLVFAQVGLGYSGRTSLDARAWHIPNGVAIFGLATWLAARNPVARPAAD
jgi:hypothetical protein